MLRIVKIELMCCVVLLLFECYSMESTFNRTVIENATDKQHLFERLQAISGKEDKSLAHWYLTLYGDHVLEGEERRRIFNSINPLNRDKITATAAYVVKALFGQAKRKLYEVNMFDECIRVAELLLSDTPQLASGRAMNNIGDILQEARHIRQVRNDVAHNIAELRKQGSNQAIGLAAIETQ